MTPSDESDDFVANSMQMIAQEVADLKPNLSEERRLEGFLQLLEMVIEVGRAMQTINRRQKADGGKPFRWSDFTPTDYVARETDGPKPIRTPLKAR